MPLDRAKLLAKKKRHYERHKNEICRKSRNRYAANPAPAIARAKTWAEKNPDKVDAKKRRQRQERKEELALAAIHGKEARPAVIVAKNLVHKAGLRAFISGRTTAPIRTAAPASKRPFEGALNLGRV